MCAGHLTQRDGYQATTQGQLKEQLYQEIIHYFDKGKVRSGGPGLRHMETWSSITTLEGDPPAEAPVLWRSCG